MSVTGIHKTTSFLLLIILTVAAIIMLIITSADQTSQPAVLPSENNLNKNNLRHNSEIKNIKSNAGENMPSNGNIDNNGTTCQNKNEEQDPLTESTVSTAKSNENSSEEDSEPDAPQPSVIKMDKLPPEFEAQLAAGQQALPPDLEEQLRMPQQELPSDIKQSLNIAPRQVTTEEVNSPR